MFLMITLDYFVNNIVQLKEWLIAILLHKSYLFKRYLQNHITTIELQSSMKKSHSSNIPAITSSYIIIRNTLESVSATNQY